MKKDIEPDMFMKNSNIDILTKNQIILHHAVLRDSQRVSFAVKSTHEPPNTSTATLLDGVGVAITQHQPRRKRGRSGRNQDHHESSSAMTTV
jgi:hypothetical protein